MAVSTASYPDRLPVSIRVSLRACCTDYAAQITVHVARDEPQGLFGGIGGRVLRAEQVLLDANHRFHVCVGPVGSGIHSYAGS